MELGGDALDVERPEVMTLEPSDDHGVEGLARIDHGQAGGGEAVAQQGLGLGQLGFDAGIGGDAQGDAPDLGELEGAVAGSGPFGGGGRWRLLAMRHEGQPVAGETGDEAERGDEKDAGHEAAGFAGVRQRSTPSGLSGRGG